MSVWVRAATEADLDAMLMLNQGIQRLHADWYPDDFGREIDQHAARSRFAALLTEPRQELAVAEADGAIVGYVWIELQVRPPSPFHDRRDRIYVHHLSVDPRLRRRGVAAALFRHIEGRAATQGIDDIYLETWAANTDAHAFFAAQGFTRLKLMFRKRLGQVRDDGR